MTSYYSNTSLTSSVQLEPDSSSDNMLSGFPLIQNKKNDLEFADNSKSLENILAEGFYVIR